MKCWLIAGNFWFEQFDPSEVRCHICLIGTQWQPTSSCSAGNGSAHGHLINPLIGDDREGGRIVEDVVVLVLLPEPEVHVA